MTHGWALLCQAFPLDNAFWIAGAGELLYKRFCAHLDYVRQDLAQYDGQGDAHGLQTGKWDQTQLDIVSYITNIPEPDVSFDAIMCIEVLEHLPSPEDAFKVLSRLLKHNGILILTAPFCSLPHYSSYFTQTGNFRYFYEYLLNKLGFGIVQLLRNGNYFEYLAQELSRLPSAGVEYSNDTLNWFERKAQGILLVTLNRLSKNDRGSEDLLSFGLNVLEEKVAD